MARVIRENSNGRKKTTINCSFGRKDNNNVKAIIAGPDVSICNECIEICDEILEDAGHRPKKSKSIPEVDLEKLGIKPRFNKLKFTQRENHCFYLGPFLEPFNTIDRDHLIKALKSQ